MTSENFVRETGSRFLDLARKHAVVTISSEIIKILTRSCSLEALNRSENMDPKNGIPWYESPTLTGASLGLLLRSRMVSPGVCPRAENSAWHQSLDDTKTTPSLHRTGVFNPSVLFGLRTYVCMYSRFGLKRCTCTKLGPVDHGLVYIICRCNMLYRMYPCVAQTEPRTPMLVHADFTASSRQHEQFIDHMPVQIRNHPSVKDIPGINYGSGNQLR